MRRTRYPITLSALILMGVSLVVLAQVQKGKNCFWSWHSGIQNWCWYSQNTGLCNSYCVQDLVWFGECQKQSGYQCQETWGPTYVRGSYVSCASTEGRKCACNTDWVRFDGWFYGRTCVGGPI